VSWRRSRTGGRARHDRQTNLRGQAHEAMVAGALKSLFDHKGEIAPVKR
jgi:hypothetical protein